MKKIISILILALSINVAFNASAQESKEARDNAHHEKWEKFRKEKHDFYIKTMELTPEQAAEFIPIYEEMEKKKFEANREIRRERRTIKNNQNITDEQYKAAAERALALDEKIFQIEKEYYVRFCEILTPRQQFLYHCCEPEFQKQVINKKHHKGPHDKN